MVSVDGVRREVNIGLLLTDGQLRIEVGDWVLVHVGFAMEKIDEDEATRHLGYIKEMGNLFDEELESFVETRPI
jgi:hydrogenase expression/formation protein HypC